MDAELLKQLIRGNYILYFNQNIVVTNKFLREFERLPSYEELTKNSALTPVVKKKAEIEVVLPEGTMPFKQFILDAKIPQMSNTRDPYPLNKYNSQAEKIFLKALKSGIDYKVLLMATMNYYKKGNYHNHIGNFFIKGIWRGEYEDMLTAIKTNTVSKHIKNTDDATRWER